MDDDLRYPSLFLIERTLPVDAPSLPRRLLQGTKPVATLSDSRSPAAIGYFHYDQALVLCAEDRALEVALA
jgi:hypothetical protein